MWVRIQEISFPVERCDDVVDHVRGSVLARYDGHDYRGFRLLVDRPNGSALEVSYWATAAAARADVLIELSESAPSLGIQVVRTDCYELAVDAG